MPVKPAPVLLSPAQHDVRHLVQHISAGTERPHSRAGAANFQESGNPRTPPVGFQNSAIGSDLVFQAARSYSLMRPPRTARRWIRSWERSAGGWSGRGGGSWRPQWRQRRITFSNWNWSVHECQVSAVILGCAVVTSPPPRPAEPADMRRSNSRPGETPGQARKPPRVRVRLLRRLGADRAREDRAQAGAGDRAGSRDRREREDPRAPFS